MRYQDFVVQIGFSPAGLWQARVAKSPAGEGEHVAPLPFWLTGASPPEEAPAGGPVGEDRAGGAERDVRRRHQPAPAAHELGGRLHELLFSGVVGRLWDRSLGSLRGRRDEGLRLRLQIDQGSAAALANLPWELLYRADTASYLALDRQTPILRHLEVAQPVAPPPLPTALKVLGVAAAPRELAALDLATEKVELAGHRQPKRRWQVAFLPGSTVEELRRALVEQGSHVLHFMGHGQFDGSLGEGALVFEDGRGGSLPFTGSALATKLAGLPALRLVVLNACDTAASGHGGNAYGGVAAALVRGGLPAVVAMQRPISDDAAIAFSKAFYRELAAGSDLEVALTEGRQAIHTLDPQRPEWAVPVLFSRVAGAGLFSDPVAAAARRRRLATAAVAAALLLSLALPPVRAGLRAFLGGEKVYAVELEQALATGVDGLDGRLAAVEILADGRMRLHFEFENHGKKDRLLGFDLRQTYLADEHGNAYAVKGSSSPLPNAPALLGTVPAGDSRSYWLDFPAPQDGARRLHVELASPPSSETSFMPFQVALPAYPEELSKPSAAPARLPETDALPLEVKIDSGRKDVFSEVRQLEVGEQGMRLSFDMWNRGTQPLAADFDPARIELRDDRGNVLKPWRMGYFDQGEVRDMKVDTVLRRAVRTRLFLEFRSPPRPSESWRLQLATRPGSDFSFTETALQVAATIFDRVRASFAEFEKKAQPKLEVRQRTDPPPTPAPAAEPAAEPLPEPVVPAMQFEVAEGEQELATTNEAIRAKLSGVYRLTNQRLRFVVQLGNGGGSPVEVALRLAGTKLSDDQGRQFRLLASTFGEAGAGGPEVVRFTLAPGTQRELSFEFSGRVQGTELFTFLLGSADPDNLRFKPIQASLPPE